MRAYSQYFLVVNIAVILGCGQAGTADSPAESTDEPQTIVVKKKKVVSYENN